MKKCKKILGVLLAVVLLVGAVPAYAAETTTGLNGNSGKWSEFDQSVYDTVVSSSEAKSSTFTWPSSGTVLIRASATSSSYTIAKFNGLTIPAGLVVDIYKYAGGSTDTYTLLGHFDTTDGKAYTIGSSSSSNSNTGNTNSSSNTGTSNSSGNSSSGTKQWGTVHKTFIPYNKPASYTHSYTDVSSNAWYYDAVMTVTEGGLLAGYGNGLAGPNDPLTRAQLAIIRTRLGSSELTDGYQETSFDGYYVFKDNATATRAWAAIALAGDLPIYGTVNLTSYELSLITSTAGVDGGLLTGYAANDRHAVGSTSYPVYDSWRASLSRDIDYRTSIDEFPDGDKIHQWIEENYALLSNYLIVRGTKEQRIATCETYFLRAWNLGMFSGIDDKGTFDPYGAITRGQLCQVLYSMGWTTAKSLDYYYN